MGCKCSCNGDKENAILSSNNIYELAEAIEIENDLLQRETYNQKNSQYILENQNELLEHLATYADKFKSIPSDSINNEDFLRIKEILNKCYYYISRNKDCTNYKRELEYLVDVKLIHDLGLSY